MPNTAHKFLGPLNGFLKRKLFNSKINLTIRVICLPIQGWVLHYQIRIAGHPAKTWRNRLRSMPIDDQLACISGGIFPTSLPD